MKLLTKDSKELNVTLAFVFIAFVCFYFADMQATTLHPFLELGKFFSSIIHINFSDINTIFDALLQTVYIATISIFFSSFFGFILAIYYKHTFLKVVLAFTRSIHEIFWALLFLQIFGLSTVTAIFAIVLPYSAILAKVYAEILEEHNKFDDRVVPHRASKVSLFFYTKLPDALPHIVSYSLYRFECALKSSAILGFVGISTLGYYLESAFMQGVYSDVWLMLILFYITIATIPYWFNKFTALLIFIVSFVNLEISFSNFSLENFIRFVTSDIVPAPLRNEQGLEGLSSWFVKIFENEIVPGTLNTIVLTQVSLILTAIIAIITFPMVSKKFTNKWQRLAGNIFLVVLRSTPEYILAFLFLQIFGPSMLPAALALMLHNGAIIGFIIGKQTNELGLRADVSSKRVNLYSYEVLPRIYNSFLAFLFYRWEVIMRESAILGVLGVATLGFYIDSAIADIKLDKVILLLFFTALLNILIDYISRKCRAYLRHKDTVVTCGCDLK